MQILLVILSVALLGTIIYFAVSPKSSRLLKFTALVALALIAISVGVCGIFLLRGPGKAKEAVPLLLMLDEAAEPPKKTDTTMILSFALVFATIMGLVIMTARKNKLLSGAPLIQKNPGNKALKKLSKEGNSETAETKGTDVGFDLELD